MPVAARRAGPEGRPDVPVVDALVERAPTPRVGPAPPELHPWPPRPGAKDLLRPVVKLSVVEGRFRNRVPDETGRLANNCTAPRGAQQGARRNNGRGPVRGVAGVVVAHDGESVVEAIPEVPLDVSGSGAPVDRRARGAFRACRDEDAHVVEVRVGRPYPRQAKNAVGHGPPQPGDVSGRRVVGRAGTDRRDTPGIRGGRRSGVAGGGGRLDAGGGGG